MLGIYARTSRDNPLEVVSTIDQQIKAGIEFANKNGFEYRVYADKGISGYKIADEEDKDPFNNRPEFTKLINDIKQGLVDCVWVWEHSRISRNQYASAYIFNIFQNNKITLYEKDKEFNLSDPTNQMLRQILDAVAQYERQLIVGRTTRGLYNAINSGKRAHAKFFGYKRVGRDKNGNLIWEPVESEIEQLKSWYKQYQEGKSLRSIILNQISKKSEIETQVLLQRATKLGRFLAHAEYTGYNLNMKGLEVLHKFEKCEIGNLEALKNKDEYWVKSIAYPIEIISINEWVSIREKLQLNKLARAKNEASKRRAEKSLATGLIKCSCCGLYYYYYHMRYTKKSGILVNASYYYHKKLMGNKDCSNKPKSLSVNKIDTIYEIFVYFYFLAFDKNKSAIEDSIKARKIEIMKIKESQKAAESEIEKLRRQIQKFNLALDETEDVNTITVLANRISVAETKIKELSETIAKCHIALNTKNDALNKIEKDLSFYTSIDQILNFHNKFNLEEKRSVLLKTIDESVLFGKYLIIKTANTLFIFDTRKTYSIPEAAYDELKENNIIKMSDPFKNIINLNLEWRPWLIDDKKLKQFFSDNNIKYDFDGYAIIF